MSLEAVTLDELEVAFLDEQYSPGRPAKAELLRRGREIAPWIATRVLEWPNLAACHALEVMRDVADASALPAALVLAQRHAMGAPGADRLVLRAAVDALARFSSSEDARRWVRTTIQDRAGLDDLARGQLVTRIAQTLVTHGEASFVFEVVAPLAESALAGGRHDPAWEAARGFLAEPGAQIDPRWMPLALALRARDPTWRSLYAAIAARSRHPDLHAHVVALHRANALDDRVWFEALDPADRDDHAILRMYLDHALAAGAAVRLARTDRDEMLALAARRIAEIGATAEKLQAHAWGWACLQLASPALAQVLWDAEQAVKRVKGATSEIRTAKQTVASAFEWARSKLVPGFAPAPTKPAPKKAKTTKKPPAKPRDTSYPFLFFGADPAHWIEGASCGHRFQICFHGVLSKAKKTAFAKLRSALALEENDCGPPVWGTLDKNTWVELCVGDSEPFLAMREWLALVDETIPIAEVVFLGATRENPQDAWTQWSYEQQPDGPRRAPDLGGEYDGFYQPAERV